MTKFAIGAALLATTACTQIPYGGEVDFAREGIVQCVDASGNVVTGTQRDPVRCGPQSQPVSAN